MSAHNELWADINVLAKVVVVSLKLLCLFVHNAYNNCHVHGC